MLNEKHGLGGDIPQKPHPIPDVTRHKMA